MFSLIPYIDSAVLPERSVFTCFSEALFLFVDDFKLAVKQSINKDKQRFCKDPVHKCS